MPMGAMPKGAFHSSPNKVVFVVLPETFQHPRQQSDVLKRSSILSQRGVGLAGPGNIAK